MSNVYVKQIGTGPKEIVLLHGWGNTHQTLEMLGNLLKDQARVHLIDLPGFGKSPAPPDTFTAKDYALVIADYLEENNLSEITLVGHSFGGKISVFLANLYPEKVKRLVLISASGIRGKKRRGIIFLAKAIKTYDRIFNTHVFYSWFAPRYASKDWKNATALRPILVRTVNEDVSEEIASIKQPTLILWGQRDKDTPIEMGRKFHSFVKNSKLIEYPQAGHHPFLDTASHLCARHILQFMEASHE